MARGPNGGDWIRNCGESSEERVDVSNQRMGRRWLVFVAVFLTAIPQRVGSLATT